MKQWEVLKLENVGKRYIDECGYIWEVVGDNNLNLSFKCDGKNINNEYLLGRINNMELEEVSKCNLKVGDKYLYINNYLYIKESFFDNDKIDYILIHMNNLYPYTKTNKQEVLKKVELIRDRKLLQEEIRKFAKENNTEKIDWSNKNQIKYNLRIDYYNNNIYVGSTYAYRALNQIYFNNEYIAEKALEKFGNRIKELYIDNDIDV